MIRKEWWMSLLTLHATNSMTEYSWQELSRLLDENEGAIFIAHIDRFRKNVHAFESAFKKHYSNIGIGHSYKTNHLPKLCAAANEEGLYAEVVSGTEFKIARALGVNGARILFNGPAKTEAELAEAFAQGALVNVDSLSEARKISNIASERAGVTRLGLRCNLDLEWKGSQSRFGLSETSGELDKAWELLSTNGNIQIEGLHCHSSFDRSADSYNRRMIRLIEIADRLFGTKVPQFLDIGGGFAGPMPDDLRKQFSVTPPTYDDYAAAICSPLCKRYGQNGPELIIEPGVGLLGNVFEYAFRVEHVKQISEKWFAVTSGASHHIKIVPNDISLPTRLLECPDIPANARKGNSIDVAGFTCLEHDLIYRGFQAPLARGDILVTENVGAYSMVSSPDFIRTSPPVYERAGGNWLPLRYKQTVSSYLSEFNW